MDRAELLLDCHNQHGEGVLWNPKDGRVWWTDIHGWHLWWYEPESDRSGSVTMPDRACCFAPRRSGGFIVAFAKQIAFFDPESGTVSSIHRFEPDKPDTRLNDGRTDRQGRFIAGGMNEGSSEPVSTVVRVDPDGSVSTIISGVGCANSICFSPDGRTMYFADSFAGTIWAYDYDPRTALPSSRRVLKDFQGEAGIPDGSCVDAEGAVWNAVWEGQRIVRILPDGRADRTIEVPVLKPTCCAFGGAELDTLYITTSRLAMTPEQLAAGPTAGALFAFRPGVRGLADQPFAG
ncbi:MULTISPECIES: SMP-30/gluconolactonase/LRE family protein [unclassified Sinorhizobium]|uniref:SMP-30/gluconolactonase/LRE family protein n=1 Tax=unclassified Sinorhizobium TaxID=2613772 RepID=UPI003523732C